MKCPKQARQQRQKIDWWFSGPMGGRGWGKGEMSAEGCGIPFGVGENDLELDRDDRCTSF